MKKVLVFIVLMLAVCARGRTQWTLQQCIDTAVANNLTIIQQGLSVALTNADLQQSKWNRWPQLNAAASQNFNFGRSLDQTTYQYINQSAATNSFTLNAGIVLFNGGQLNNAIRQNQINTQAAIYDWEQVKNEVALSVINEFVQLIYAKEGVKNAQAQLSSTQALIEQTRLFVQAGKKAESDLVQLQAQLAMDEYNLGAAKNAVRSNSLLLQQLMEVPFNENFDILVPVLPEPEMLTEKDPAAIYQAALNTQPYIRSGQLKVTSEEIGMRIIKGSALPKITLGAGAATNYSTIRKQTDVLTQTYLEPIGFLKDNTDQQVIGYVVHNQYNSKPYPFFDQLRSNLNQAVFINVSIPIFNNHQVRTNIVKQELAIQAARYANRTNLNDLRKKVEQAFIDVTNAQLNYTALLKALAAEKRSWQDLQIKFEASKNTATDLLVEKNKYAQQESLVLQAKFELILKRKIVDYYEGLPLTF